MSIRKNDSNEFRGLWDEARTASRLVAEWPAWKRGDIACAPSTTADTDAGIVTAGQDSESESGGHDSPRAER